MKEHLSSVTDNIVKHLKDFAISIHIEICKVCVKAYSGAITRNMKHYAQRTARSALKL